MVHRDTAIESRLEAALDDARRRLRVQTVVGLALLGWIVTWGFWAHARFSSTTSDDAAAVARDHVSKVLPDARHELALSLADAAPELADRVARQVLAAPARLRAKVEVAVVDEIDAGAAELRRTLEDGFRAEVAAARVRLDAEFPNMTDRERLDAISTRFVTAWEQRLSELGQSWNEPFAASIDRLGDEVAYLSDPADLDHQSALQREILITFLELHARANERGELDAFVGRAAFPRTR